jgi:hypothetical protein
MGKRQGFADGSDTMPVHDWSLVEAGIFHAFHVQWVARLQETLNAGTLPSGYYALAEQHGGRIVADVLTLHSGPRSPQSSREGGIAVSDSPPRVLRRKSSQTSLRRSVAIRHVTGHHLVALIELVSPGNKDRPQQVTNFVTKAVAALRVGVHLLIIDLFPPGRHDPGGLSHAIADEVGDWEDSELVTEGTPLAAASFVADEIPELYAEAFGVGMELPEMPLFLDSDRYVNLPLQPSYTASFLAMPGLYRAQLEGDTLVSP